MGQKEEETGGQMSFLEHIDELRKRLTHSILFIGVAFIFCWMVSDRIFSFLAIPVREAIAAAQNRQVDLKGITGEEKILSLRDAKEGDVGINVFSVSTRLGGTIIPVGATVRAKVARDAEGKLGLFTDEAIFTDNTIIPKGVRLPVNLDEPPGELRGIDDNLTVTTAMEPFTLYVTVSLYSAIALSVPFLLFQIWRFISPGLYAHEKRYVTPFIVLSSISFLCGMAFAYYVLFPPAASYLLGLGSDFRLMLRATEYFDFIILIMLAMGAIFQMPAITYVLSRIGIVSAGFLIKSWKIALVIILVASAVISPTGDALNMMLFAAPMIFLYGISVFIARIFGQKREIPG